MKKDTEAVTVSTAPDFKPGDTVVHLDDPSVRGLVRGVVARPDGSHAVRVDGVGNLLPASALKLAEPAK